MSRSIYRSTRNDVTNFSMNFITAMDEENKQNIDATTCALQNIENNTNTSSLSSAHSLTGSK